MPASSADEHLDQPSSLGNELELYAEVRNLIADGDHVAALVDFQGPTGTITYAQRFTTRDGKIVNLEVVYDPRPFLEVSSDT